MSYIILAVLMIPIVFVSIYAIRKIDKTSNAWMIDRITSSVEKTFSENFISAISTLVTMYPRNQSGGKYEDGVNMALGVVNVSLFKMSKEDETFGIFYGDIHNTLHLTIQQFIKDKTLFEKWNKMLIEEKNQEEQNGLA